MKLTIILTLFLSLASCHDKIPDNNDLNKRNLPSFNILRVDSPNTFNTNQIPEGKQTVFFYFDPDCEYCKHQTEVIISIINDLKQTSFYFISDWPENNLKDYYTRYKLNRYPNILVGRDLNSSFGNHFKPSGVPCLAIFDKNKKLKNLIIGTASSDSIKRYLLNSI